MKKILATLFVLPFLLGCNRNQEYTGYKLTVERDESGELTESTPEELYENAITNNKDCIYYIGDDNCSSCQKLKPQLIAWTTMYKGKIYSIPLNMITNENVEKINDATVGYYDWSKNQSIPAVFFFGSGTVVFRGDDTNTMNFLNKYVQVQE